jgi:hypothetical protein
MIGFIIGAVVGVAAAVLGIWAYIVHLFKKEWH